MSAPGSPAPLAWPVDLATYPRRRLYACFRDHPLPVFSISSRLDITGFAAAVAERQLRFYTTLCCLISRVLNGQPCFRHRIVEGVLMSYQRVHPSINVALPDGSFSFADATYQGIFADDYLSIRAAIDRARKIPLQDFRQGLDDRFFLTHLPWMSFTAIQHPYTPAYASIPLISTGRSFHQDDKEWLPISLQAHHALVDGLHVAQVLAELSRLCQEPGEHWVTAPSAPELSTPEAPDTGPNPSRR
jgi:chloramphenicol O-acetyltransferase type A